MWWNKRSAGNQLLNGWERNWFLSNQLNLVLVGVPRMISFSSCLVSAASLHCCCCFIMIRFHYLSGVSRVHWRYTTLRWSIEGKHTQALVEPYQSQLCLCGSRLKCFVSNRVLRLITFWWARTNPWSLPPFDYSLLHPIIHKITTANCSASLWFPSWWVPFPKKTCTETYTQLCFYLNAIKICSLLVQQENFILVETSVCDSLEHTRNQCMQRFHKSAERKRMLW